MVAINSMCLTHKFSQFTKIAPLIFILLMLAGCSDAYISDSQGNQEYVEPENYVEHVNASFNSEIRGYFGSVSISNGRLYINKSQLLLVDTLREEFQSLGFDYTLFEDDVFYFCFDCGVKLIDFGFFSTMFSGFSTRHRDRPNEVFSYEITDETVFTFTDFRLLFGTDPYSDRRYSTNSLDEWLMHLYVDLGGFSFDDLTDEGEMQFISVPYFIIVQDGKLLLLYEWFLFTF